MEKGEAGLYAYKSETLNINNFYCRDIRGPYWRGQVRSNGAGKLPEDHEIFYTAISGNLIRAR